MPTARCHDCRRLFSENENDRKLAERIEAKYPGCECEKYSVGTGSPGPVGDSEKLHRIMVSPRDYDPATGQIARKPFEKAFSNGLSVCREIASNDDVIALVEEGLATNMGEPPRQVSAICEALAYDVRNLEDDNKNRLFCVYDQTVSRSDPVRLPVPTHAGIFQRQFARGVERADKLRRDFAAQLWDLFVQKQLAVEEIRDGLFLDVNVRAKVGQFQKK